MLDVKRQVGFPALNNHSIARGTHMQIDDFANKYNKCDRNWDYVLNIEVVQR